MEEPGGLQSMGRKESDTTERLFTGRSVALFPLNLPFCHWQLAEPLWVFA